MVIASITLIASLGALFCIVVLSGDSITPTVTFIQNMTNSTAQNATNATTATVTDKICFHFPCAYFLTDGAYNLYLVEITYIKQLFGQIMIL